MGDGEKDPLKIYVGNLSYNTTEAVLYRTFETYGKVEKGKSCSFSSKASLKVVQSCCSWRARGFPFEPFGFRAKKRSTAGRFESS